MKVVIEGFYGHGNLGDEAILEALLGALRARASVQPLVFTMRPGEVRRQGGLSALHSRRTSMARRAGAILGARLFLLGGGGLLKDYGIDSSSLRGWLANLRLARRLGRPTALACVGVESIRFPESRRQLARGLQGVDDLTVRDCCSRDLLTEIGVGSEIHVAGDLALLLGDEDIPARKAPADPPRIMVCMRHWYSKGHFVEAEGAFEAVLQAVARTADEAIRNRGATLLFVPLRVTAGDDDVSVCRRVIDKMRHSDAARLLTEAPSAREFLEILDHCDMVIGMRLHSLILAAVRGVPMIGLSYLPKVHGFMTDLGEQHFCVPLESLSHEELGMLVGETFGSYASRSTSIVRAVVAHRSRVRAAVDRWLALVR